MPGLVFGDFFHDHRYLLVVETDEEGLFAALARLDVDTGNLERIADLSDSSGWVRPAIGPNDERVYYYADRALVAVDVDGGEAEQVHEFESHRSAAFFAANAQTLVIYDQPEGGSLGELRLLEPEDNRSIRIDRDVNLSTTSVHVGARGIAFSDNGKLVAYCSGQAGELGLYVIGRDGSDRRRLSNDNLWITFGFSPNSRKIAYIEGEDLREPGTLYVANVDGSERVRLDAEVWSFQFTQNGRHLVYSKVYDLEQNEPQSELYRISLNGKDQELISRSVDGLITLLPRPD
jgi:dipeptidyl aminopeptidase/acylaminoacyl peptidase